jgi:hypothetical protein
MDAVVDALRGHDRPDWTMAAQVIEALMQSQKAKNASELRGWARRVRRFLLNGGQYTQVSGVRPATAAGVGTGLNERDVRVPAAAVPMQQIKFDDIPVPQST